MTTLRDKRDWAEAKLRSLRVLLEPSLELPAGMGLPANEDLQELVSPRGAARLLFGHYSVEELRDAFERFHIFEALRARGWSDLRITIDTTEQTRQMIRVFGVAEGQSHLIAETALRLDCYQTEAPFAPRLHGQTFCMLYILWLLMQNPRDRFTPRRPAMPGQDHPGLGIGRQVMQMYLAMARRFHCDGILNSPEFAHTAVIYSTRYRFLDPVAEGRLLALRRALSPLSLAEGSWAVYTNCVSLDRDPPQPFYWVPEEQVLPLTPKLLAHFRSPEYVRAARASFEEHRFRLDRERFARLAPLLPDGSPRLQER